MIDKLTPRILQTSKDFRAMAPTEMLDALNITVTGDEEGGAGVLKNIKGTNEVLVAHESAGFPAGENVVIGSTKDETLGVVYFFVWNENNNHSVFAYSAITNTYRLILQTPELNFDRNGFVKGDVIRVKTNPEEEAVIEVDQAVLGGDSTIDQDQEIEFEIDEELAIQNAIANATVFNFCDYVTEENSPNGITNASFIFALQEPLTELLQQQSGPIGSTNAIYPPIPEIEFPNVGAETTWYIQDTLGNVYEIPVFSVPYENVFGDIAGTNYGSVSGTGQVLQFLNIPIQNFGCPYTPPPPPDPDPDPDVDSDIDSDADTDASDEGVSINLADPIFDLNDDGSISAQDLLDFLQNFGVIGDDLLGDFNQDGFVSNADMLALLAVYGFTVEDSD